MFCVLKIIIFKKKFYKIWSRKIDIIGVNFFLKNSLIRLFVVRYNFIKEYLIDNLFENLISY